MATVVYGDEGVFNAMVFGRAAPETVEYFRQQEERREEMHSRLLPEARSFFQKGAEIFKKFNNSETLRNVRAATRQASHVFMPDQIMEYNTVAQFQQARTEMRRFIMAERSTRKRFIDGRCEGYGNRYFDSEPGLIGRDHYEYRLVTSGVFMDQPNGKFSARTEYHDLRVGDRDLDFLEKASILDTWDNLKVAFATSKDDPTSPSNREL